jgi:rhamnose transport system ATP-binding protein
MGPGSVRLAIRNVHKRFGAVSALSGVSMDVQRGEVHAMLGENGAGKSTLVNIITGVLKPDLGAIYLDGAPMRFSSVFEARAAGVSAVYQDPQLFPDLTIAENVFMGVYPRRGPGLVDFRACHEQTGRIMNALGIDLDPRRPAADLSVAERQFVAICRALLQDARLLILDEPTAALTPRETDQLFAVIGRLREAGSSVLLISHRLEDVRRLADGVTVLRDGKQVLAGALGSISDERIVAAMLGAGLGRTSMGLGQAAGEDGQRELLRIESLSSAAFHDVTFAVRAGEIVVLAGLVGSGRTELLETIFGVRTETGGRVSVQGRPVPKRAPRRMLDLGVALVPEDRDREGLVLGFSLAENVTLPMLRRVGRLGFLRRRAERRIAADQIDRLSIATPGPMADVATLSGGNRQKVVLAKWLASGPRVLLLDEPTRGIDVGAKSEIHAILRGLASEGLGVLVASSDFKEVEALAHRVIVLRAGRQVSELRPPRISEAEVVAAATLGGSRLLGGT